MKRLSLSFLSFVVIVSLIFTVALSAESSSELPKMSSIEQQQQIALQKNVVVQEEIRKNNLEDVYAGVFIDDNAELNINLVSSVDKLQMAVAQDGIHYHLVQHSLKELEGTIAKLIDRMPELDIIRLSLDEKKNKVIVSVKDLDERKISQIDKHINPETVEYEKAAFEVHVTAEDIINGTSLDFGLTVGVGARDSNGNDGFVTAGHMFYSNGTVATQNGTAIGTQRSSQFSGSVDAAFFEARKSSWPWITSYYGSQRLSNGILYTEVLTNSSNYTGKQGMSVTVFGGVSGEEDGTIISSNTAYTTEINGESYTISNVVATDYVAALGDSGAPVLWWDTNHNYAVGGLQSAAHFDQNGNWAGVSYFVRTDLAFNALNLSDL